MLETVWLTLVAPTELQNLVTHSTKWSDEVHASKPKHKLAFLTEARSSSSL